MTDDPAARVAGALRQGWHGLAGGDAATCPGCPVCSLTGRAGRLDPVATEHLQAAAGHLAAAGRELLGALGSRPGGPDQDADPQAQEAAGVAERPAPDAVDGSVPAWTTIPVSTGPTDEEHP